ncbi:hypothetical protein UP12_19600 (plasmid) [Bacillus pumilus]|uniref:hypothetical protein n=1 Tax=Bacillus pumilus TaxID=1408 RepID=UPI00077693C6|nr:hypothetical protein [Bacillus pumilus]AMM99610.1 hypothetical protein UP12_19600 [Bacillus pumilus]
MMIEIVWIGFCLFLIVLGSFLIFFTSDRYRHRYHQDRKKDKQHEQPTSERKIRKENSSGPKNKVKYGYTNKKSTNEDIQHSVLQQPIHNVYHSNSSSSHCNSSSSYDNSSNHGHSSSYDSGSSGGGCDL